MNDIQPKIVEAPNVDFIKHVYYENDLKCSVIKLTVIYEHDDYDFDIDTILYKLDDQFPYLSMCITRYSTTEVESSDLKNTTTEFKREGQSCYGIIKDTSTTKNYLNSTKISQFL